MINQCVHASYIEANPSIFETLTSDRHMLLVCRAECRLPWGLIQKYRMGEPAYDPHLQMRVYNHVFEVVDQDHGNKERENHIKALEAVVENLKKQLNK